MTNSSSAEKGAATDAEEKKSLLADSEKPVKPVVTSGELGSSEMRTIQTDCLWNLLVPIDQCQSRKPSNSKDCRAFLLLNSCCILAFTVLIFLNLSQNTHAS